MDEKSRGLKFAIRLRGPDPPSYLVIYRPFIESACNGSVFSECNNILLL
jgi:hypothetical protein